MAKLSGVSVVAEKITYNGAEYAKTDKQAEAGDIIRIASDESFLTDGGFYVVDSVDWAGDAQITDDAGDEYDTCGDDFVVFAKVSADSASPSASDPDFLGNVADKYAYANGKVYANQPEIINKKADVGDRIRITAAYGTEGKYANGDVFTVTRVRRHDGRVFVAEHDRPIAQMEYEIIPKIGVGDTVTLRKGGDWPLLGFEDSEEATVLDTNSGHSNGKYPLKVKSGGRIGFTTLDNVIPVEDSAKSQSEPVRLTERLTVGDYAKVIALGGGHSYAIGDVVKITRDDHNGRPYKGEVVATGRIGNYLKNSEVVRATPEEVAEAEKKKAISAIKPGMFAKITKFQCGDDVGTVAEITDITDFGRITYKSEKAESGTYVSGYGSYEIVPSPAKPKLKVGDKVRINVPEGVRTSCGRAGVSNSEIGEVTAVRDGEK